MRLLMNMRTYGAIIPLTAALAPRVALAQHGGGGMGGSGWMNMGGGMWLWTVVAVLAIVLLVVLISKQANQK